jgi:chloride channel protein, CIC family
MTDSPSRSTESYNPLRWFPEFLELSRQRLRPQSRLLGASLLVGVVAGLGAVVFFLACRVVVHYSLGVGAGYVVPEPKGEGPLGWLPELNHPEINLFMLALIPTVGGLISGLIVFLIAPEAEGHGTDAVIAAYHHHQGLIRPRVPLVKIVASAITVGTGGSGGREGPIAQIGAGFGSFLAGLLHLRPAERRVLLAAGMGAGIAAIFRAPLAGALFAAEVLYRSPEFESEVILPAALASVVAYCTFGLTLGNWEPLFGSLQGFTFDNPLQLLPYLVLSLFVVILAAIYTRSFYGLVHLFHKLKIPPAFKPAIGGLLTGLVGVGLYLAFSRDRSVLSVLSAGYGILQEALEDPTHHTNILHAALLLLAVALGKILTTGFSIGSGGSGGVFGPSMVIGGCGGGALGLAFYSFSPALVPQPASFVLVGMAGFFAAAAKTPFSTLVIVSEMTNNYSLLLPALWVCTISYLLSDSQSLYRSQVESRSRSPAHQGSYVRDVLAGLRVSQFVKNGEDTPVVRPGDSLATVLDRQTSSDSPVLPVVDQEGRLQGVVDLEEVNLAGKSPDLFPLILATDLMQPVLPLTPDDPLERAIELFVENDLLVLPVVTSLQERRLIGLVRRSDIAGTYLRYVQGFTRTKL